MTPRKMPKSEELEDSQKKFAEHIGYKTGMPPESIEKGVEELIDRSQPSYHECPPPYGSTVWYEKFLEITQTHLLDIVNPEFVRINIIGFRHEYTVIRGLRFLGLVDDRFKATEKLDSLRVIGGVYRERLDLIVRSAYKELFSKIVIQRAKIETLVNFFMQRYDYGERTAREATAVFIMLCKKAGIQLTQELEAKSVSTSSRAVSAKAPSRRATQAREKAIETSIPSGLTELKMDNITIHLPKNDRNAALKAKRLLELYIEGIENSEHAE